MTEHYRPQPKLDIERAVADLGGLASTQRRFAMLGIKPPTENAIRLWVYRGRVSGEWTGALLMVLGEKAPDYAIIPDEKAEEAEEEFNPFDEEEAVA
jgi:hypothetical protein